MGENNQPVWHQKWTLHYSEAGGAKPAIASRRKGNSKKCIYLCGGKYLVETRGGTHKCAAKTTARKTAITNFFVQKIGNYQKKPKELCGISGPGKNPGCKWLVQGGFLLAVANNCSLPVWHKNWTLHLAGSKTMNAQLDKDNNQKNSSQYPVWMLWKMAFPGTQKNSQSTNGGGPFWK